MSGTPHFPYSVVLGVIFAITSASANPFPYTAKKKKTRTLTMVIISQET